MNGLPVLRTVMVVAVAFASTVHAGLDEEELLLLRNSHAALAGVEGGRHCDAPKDGSFAALADPALRRIAATMKDWPGAGTGKLLDALAAARHGEATPEVRTLMRALPKQPAVGLSITP